MISVVLRALGSLILGIVWLIYCTVAALILLKQFIFRYVPALRPGWCEKDSDTFIHAVQDAFSHGTPEDESDQQLMAWRAFTSQRQSVGMYSYSNMILHANPIHHCFQYRLHALRNTNHASWKPLMLFLHGFPENSYSWRNQLKYFRDTYTVVALDMRGFGDSDAPQKMSEYSMDTLCLDVVATINACGYESCILVGHDWGACLHGMFLQTFQK